jgi:ketosteroid isomerase-like protein
MSQENVEIVRAAFVAVFSTGDVRAGPIGTAPGYEVDLSRMISPLRGVYDADEARRVFREFAQSWDSQRYEPDEFIDAGEHVVTPFTSYHRGRQGIEVRARAAFVWTIRDGQVARLCFYQEREEALEAVGLEA